MNYFSKIIFLIFQKKFFFDTNGKKSIAKKTGTLFFGFQNFENESSSTIDAHGFQKKR
jgi:hypothetical protein